jgi:hypothetical protein
MRLKEDFLKGLGHARLLARHTWFARSVRRADLREGSFHEFLW